MGIVAVNLWDQCRLALTSSTPVSTNVGLVRFDFGRELLKWIAVASMTIDHIGAVLYPEVIVFRIIGRLAFPIFSYLLVLGVNTTRSVKHYFLRLLLFGCLSQVPFQLALKLQPFEMLNIFFTLAIGILVIRSFRKNPYLILPILLASIFLNIDYGVYGIALIVTMCILKDDVKAGVASFILLNLLFLPSWNIQIFSLLALPILLLHRMDYVHIFKDAGLGAHYSAYRKYFFYAYYPFHLLLLYMIRLRCLGN
ncbi:MAG: TraX family protein [Nitrososphaerota archaeon]|nr:conjugal transfer protein TraX [Candidatus Bathyarchaeota archaeon]MDW8049297.1 TraX family protein [Nitrososphaerota archaeon]